jgi:hypothetical protein
MITNQIETYLKPLIGLKLSIARRAADMRIFHFGQIRPVENGTAGEYALHIQCPWRIEGPQGIVTGRSDLWEPIESHENIDWDSWDYENDGNLQDKLIGALLGEYDPQTDSYVNNSNQFVVEDVQADKYGGFSIALSTGYRIAIFPAGSRAEDWRIFCPESDALHFVVVGGKIE